MAPNRRRVVRAATKCDAPLMKRQGDGTVPRGGLRTCPICDEESVALESETTHKMHLVALVDHGDSSVAPGDCVENPSGRQKGVLKRKKGKNV
jgi:hypothetical protein